MRVVTALRACRDRPPTAWARRRRYAQRPWRAESPRRRNPGSSGEPFGEAVADHVRGVHPGGGGPAEEVDGVGAKTFERLKPLVTV